MRCAGMKNYEGDRRVWVWGAPPPNMGFWGLAPKKFSLKFNQILAIFAHFKATRCIQEELFTAVKTVKTTYRSPVRGPVFVRLTSRQYTGSIHHSVIAFHIT